MERDHHEYTNSQIKELILEYCHDMNDRRMLYWRLVDGMTFEAIALKIGMTTKTVRIRIHKQEEILFKHIPD